MAEQPTRHGERDSGVFSTPRRQVTRVIEALPAAAAGAATALGEAGRLLGRSLDRARLWPAVASAWDGTGRLVDLLEAGLEAQLLVASGATAPPPGGHGWGRGGSVVARLGSFASAAALARSFGSWRRSGGEPARWFASIHRQAALGAAELGAMAATAHALGTPADGVLIAATASWLRRASPHASRLALAWRLLAESAQRDERASPLRCEAG